MDNVELTDLAIANLIEAMGMFIHDIDVLLSKEDEGIYFENNYSKLAEQIRKRG